MSEQDNGQEMESATAATYTEFAKGRARVIQEEANREAFDEFNEKPLTGSLDEIPDDSATAGFMPNLVQGKPFCLPKTPDRVVPERPTAPPMELLEAHQKALEEQVEAGTAPQAPQVPPGMAPTQMVFQDPKTKQPKSMGTITIRMVDVNHLGYEVSHDYNIKEFELSAILEHAALEARRKRGLPRFNGVIHGVI